MGVPPNQVRIRTPCKDVQAATKAPLPPPLPAQALRHAVPAFRGHERITAREGKQFNRGYTLKQSSGGHAGEHGPGGRWGTEAGRAEASKGWREVGGSKSGKENSHRAPDLACRRLQSFFHGTLTESSPGCGRRAGGSPPDPRRACVQHVLEAWKRRRFTAAEGSGLRSSTS